MKSNSFNIQPRIKLYLLRCLREKKNSFAHGFTLVELMVVVAVVGVLSAVALPQYLKARDAARAGSVVGEAISLAKECSVYVAAGGVGRLPTGIVTDGSGTCNTAGGSYSGTWAPVFGMRCLDANTDGAFQASSVTVSVSGNGTMNCSLS